PASTSSTLGSARAIGSGKGACGGALLGFGRQVGSMSSGLSVLERHGELPYNMATMATSARRKQPTSRELKKERIELRVAPSAKLLIQRAMAVSGLTAGDLAYEGARRVLDEHERMVLVGTDRDAFLNAVMNPPEPTEKLMAALRRHREILG